jgi:hypothetical protein
MPNKAGIEYFLFHSTDQYLVCCHGDHFSLEHSKHSIFLQDKSNVVPDILPCFIITLFRHYRNQSVSVFSHSDVFR